VYWLLGYNLTLRQNLQFRVNSPCINSKNKVIFVSCWFADRIFVNTLKMMRSPHLSVHSGTICLQVKLMTAFVICTFVVKGKSKVIPLQARFGPEGG